MNEADLRHRPLPRRYALWLGPIAGALVGCSGFGMMGVKDALVMVALFALIGLVAGVAFFLRDRKRRPVG